MQGKEWHNLSKAFTFADDSTNFEKLKKEGVKAVLLKYSAKVSKNIKKASALGMKIMVEMPYSARDSVNVIKPLAGRVSVQDGVIEYASIKDIKKAIKSIGQNVEGFIIPIPEVSGLLWNNEIEESCSVEDGDSYDLFDDEKEISNIRSRYYISAQKYLYENYMLPQNELLKGIGKRAVFYIGKKELQYDLIGNLVNTTLLKHMGFLLGISCEKEVAETEFGFRKGDYIFCENFCENMTQKRVTKDILLVKPMRGVMERYVETGRRNRIETTALASAVEGVYFCDMLKEKGYAFDVADEFSFMTKRNLSKYNDILICESCLFTDKEMSKINRLLEKGIRINSNDLISELSEQGEE